MRTIIFDIETGPLDETALAEVEPQFKAAGNLKDPAKIAADIEDKRKDWREKAALSAITGQVLAIGYRNLNEDTNVLLSQSDEFNEASVISTFWSMVNDYPIPMLIGFNIERFDLPFLFRRSWANGIIPPGFLRKGRYWSDLVIDLRTVWQCGDYQAEGSLDAVSRTLKVGRKNGDGKNFAELLRTDRTTAMTYLDNDVNITRKVFEVLVPQY